jgi:hypothetical protein
MAMIVRHKHTGEYVTEDAWTNDRKLARDFLRLDYAQLYRSNQQNAADLEIVYNSDHGASDFDVVW